LYPATLQKQVKDGDFAPTKNGEKMSYTVLPNGSIVADTEDEAIALSNRILANGNLKPPASSERSRPTASKESNSEKTTKKESNSEKTTKKKDLTGFIAAIAGNPKKMLEILVKSPDGMTSEDLAKAMDVEPKLLPSYIRSVRLHSSNHGFGNKGIMKRQKITIEGIRTSKYKINEQILGELKSRLP
jgi:hypothetical protein